MNNESIFRIYLVLLAKWEMLADMANNPFGYGDKGITSLEKWTEAILGAKTAIVCGL